MQTVAVDILGPFPGSLSGNRYILVAMDYFTRWAEAYAIPNHRHKLVSNFFIPIKVTNLSLPYYRRSAELWVSTKLKQLPTTRWAMD